MVGFCCLVTHSLFFLVEESPSPWRILNAPGVTSHFKVSRLSLSSLQTTHQKMHGGDVWTAVTWGACSLARPQIPRHRTEEKKLEKNDPFLAGKNGTGWASARARMTWCMPRPPEEPRTSWPVAMTPEQSRRHCKPVLQKYSILGKPFSVTHRMQTLQQREELIVQI